MTANLPNCPTNYLHCHIDTGTGVVVIHGLQDARLIPVRELYGHRNIASFASCQTHDGHSEAAVTLTVQCTCAIIWRTDTKDKVTGAHQHDGITSGSHWTFLSHHEFVVAPEGDPHTWQRTNQKARKALGALAALPDQLTAAKVPPSQTSLRIQRSLRQVLITITI